MSPHDVIGRLASEDRQDLTAYARGQLTFAELSERGTERHRAHGSSDGAGCDAIAVYDATREAATSLMGSFAWLAQHAESSEEAERWWAAYSIVYRERAQVDARDQQAQFDALAEFKAREVSVQAVDMSAADGVIESDAATTAFNKAALRTLFAEGGNESNPVAVVMGGQPGAGKTRATQFACELYDRRVVIISAHDFQALHPHYKHLQTLGDQHVYQGTQAFVDELVAKSVAYAMEHRISVLVEETFSDVQAVMSTAHDFADAGFDVHAVALAVQPSLSGASALSRFYDTAGDKSDGWSPKDAHSSALRGLPGSLEALGSSHLVRRVTVLSRDGEILFDTRESGDGAALEVLMHVANRQKKKLNKEEQAMVDEVRRRAEGLKSRGA